MGMMERFASLSAGGPVLDPQFNAVTMLLRSNKTNGANNNAFIDSSPNNFSVTRNGNVTQGSFSPFNASGWCNFFDATTSYIGVSNAALALGTGNFDIEFYSYRTVDGPYLAGTGNTTGAWAVAGGTGSAIHFRIDTLASNLLTGTAPQNQWNKINVTRTSGTLALYVNDVLQQSVANSTNFSLSNLGIGSFSQATNFAAAGYIANFKIIKAGVVVIDTCRNNRFLDNSSNAFALTVTGNPSVQAFSPFAPSDDYDPLLHGGSAYFDGSGDTLVAGAVGDWNFMHNGGSFTLDTAIYGFDFSVAREYVNTINGSGDIGFILSIGAGGAPQFQFIRLNNTGSSTCSVSLVKNTWNYIRISYDSTTKVLSWFVNGAAAGTTSFSAYTFTTSNSTTPLWIAYRQSQTGINYFWGYIGYLKLSNAASSNPGVPSAPPTSDANTRLLLNFTNAGVFDAAGRHMIETSAGAIVANGTYQPTATGSAGTNTITVSSATNLKRGQSVSGTGIASGAYVTAISGTTITLSANNTGAVSGTMTFVDPTKWGNGSFYFPGTGNSALLVRDTQLMKVGTQAFTYETWTFAIANQVMMFQFQSNSNGFSAIRLQPTGTNQYTLYMSANGSTWPVQTQSTGTFPLYQWVHVAVNRDGSNITVFVNGDVFISANVSVNAMSDVNNVIGNIWSGGALSGSSSFLGYMEDFRTTLGAARYAVGTGANANKMVFKGTNILALPQSQFPVQ